ncbi:MAG: glycosyltransferase family 2 protein [Candidatus Margulisbacteria bacterium]|nr:glycosyltransferase family 2 protein [Candidatus Margulisiibacteriota bacterium]MBU1616615.1 glycosyltransferase family 2 protein [Candidatus Margulisiibacteriota bacterium]
MRLSVIIGTYNQKEVLRQTLESLFRQTLASDQYEIQLVDSSSTDGTDQMVQELHPPCRFNYQRVENKGKTFARNLGIKAATGEIVFLTDADMVAKETLLEEHLKAHRKKMNTSFEGLTINPDGKPYIKSFIFPNSRLKWSYFLTGNLSLPKKIILEAGLFDERFKGYGWEDIELGYRLSRMKVPLYYLPGAVNYHHHPVSDAGMLERKFEMGRSAALFYKKHPNLTIKMFLGINPLAMGIYSLLKRSPKLLARVKSRYLLEEYQYRRGLEAGLQEFQ